MSATINIRQNVRFKTGWIILLAAAGLMMLNHVVLFFAEDEPVLFAGFAAFTAYALVVIAVPFRQRERLAWYAGWIQPIGLAAPAALANDPNIAPFYYAVAAASVVGLFLTMPEFVAKVRS